MFKRLLMLTAVFLIAASYAFAQSGSITGTITDSETGESLPATNVFVEELDRGTSTNTNGEYTFENISAGTYTLRVTFVGYSEFTETVEVGNDEVVADIQLNAQSTQLDELVVVGFGKQERRKVVGSVSSVTSEELNEGFATTIDKAIQGKTAGVQVTSTSGVLGAPVNVRVRGTTSINASSQPLYVVDGVPVVDDELGGNLGVGGDGGINPLINMNPNDIESVEVLKDASASAIYGSRGSNGVVLITTKSGQAGETQINIGVSAGFSNPTNEYDLLTGPEYIQMNNYKSGGDINPSDVSNTNWADIVTRQGNVQNYNASVSGGDPKTQYFLSGTYSIEEGYARPNQLEDFSGRVRVNHNYNEKLNVELSVSPSRSVNNRIPTSNQVSAPYTFAALEAPVIPQFYNNGDLNDGRDSDRALGNAFAGFGGTPYSNILGNDISSVTTQILTNASIGYDFLPELTLDTDFSVQYLQNQETGKQATFSTDGFPSGAANARNEQFLNYSWRTTLQYSQDWDDHALDFLVGTTFERTEQEFINVFGTNFISNDLKTLNSAANIDGGGGFISSYAYQNNLARISYDYKDRYLLTLTGSYQGTSRFAKDVRYGFFPSVAAGWIISDEPFMDGVDALSFLKLRGSYGLTGNSNIDNFEYPALLGSGNDYAGSPGVVVSQLASPTLEWEQTAQLDVGLEYGFLDQRISGSIGYYLKNTSDLLLDVPVSNTNGFTTFTENNGEVQNSGFEFDVSADILQGDLLWSVNANISTLNNEVKSLAAGAFNDGENRVEVGEPIGVFFLREYKGVDPENGNALFADGDGGTTANFNAAPRKKLGSPFPDFFGGFGTQLGYKGIDANVNFQYSSGNEVYWSDGTFLATNLSSIWNQQVSQLDYWTPDNTNASIPEPRSASAGPNGNQNSSRYLEDASYLRLKSATIGYSIPTELVSGYDLRIYVQGTNLITFDDYKGLDPEVTPSAGANVNQGNVFFQLPQSRTILFGLELGL